MKPQEAEHIFRSLSSMLREATPNWLIAKDEPQHLEVQAVWPGSSRKEQWFGAVTVKKNYVSYHLMPLYTRPELLEGLPEGLRKRMQGKTCFNFSKADAELFQALRTLTQQCVAAWA